MKGFAHPTSPSSIRGVSLQSPHSPTFPLYLGLSLLGGLFFGSVGALFLESIDDRVQSMEMIEQSLNTPLLGDHSERGFVRLASRI